MDLLAQLTTQAQQAKLAGQFDVALTLYHQARQQFPHSVSVVHNLASLYGDLKQFDASRKYAEQALRNGSKAPQTWLVYARALLGLQAYEQAAKAYQNSIQIDPSGYDAHREYAQLVWMQTGDVGAALHMINGVLAQQVMPGLVLLKAQVYEYAEDLESAHRILIDAVARWPQALPIVEALTYNAMRLNKTEASVTAAQQMVEMAPKELRSHIAASYAYAAAGEGEKALASAHQCLMLAPESQQAIACQANALRILYALTGQQEHLDAYRALYDYDSLVCDVEVDVPNGWSSRDSFFADIATELKALHPFKTHPFGQSVRNGSQLPNILSFNNPVLDAFHSAIDGPIRDHLQRIGQSKHPLRSRNTFNWKIDGIWSVWLRPGGYHENHVHPDGWLSSACYIELPDGVDNETEKSGWLRLGAPMLPTQPELNAERWVKPQVGHLVMFPSYMWHGTNTFSGDKPRLSIALDIVPAE